MSTFKGFKADDGDKFRLMHLNVKGFDASTFGTYNGLMNMLTYCPMLLLAGPLVENWNRKFVIGVCCIGWGLCTVAHAFATSMTTLYILMLGIGLLQGIYGPVVYSIITDFFPPEKRVRAFFVFSLLQQLGDTMRFLTSPMIRAFGYKVAWWVCGCFGIATGILMLFTVGEPARQSEQIVVEEDDEKKKDQVVSSAARHTKYTNYEAKKTLTGVVLKKKKKSMGSICSEYKRSFGLLFTNFAATMIIIGCFFRLW